MSTTVVPSTDASPRTTPEPRRGVRGTLRELTIGRRWWIGTLVGYVFTRLVATAGFLQASRHQVAWDPNFGYDGDLSFWQLMTIAWDGRWYSMLIEEGYPSELPRTADGEVMENPWAFYPLFPMTARLLSTIPGVSTGAAAVGLAAGAGLVAVLLLRQLVLTVEPELRHTSPWFVFAAPLALAAFPSAGIFSAAYSDSLAIAILLGALLMLVKRRYFWFCVLVLVIGLARPLAVPIGIVVIVHFWPLVVTRWRRERVLAWRHLGLFVLIGVVSLASVALWPTIAGIVTGTPDALFVTQAAWKRPEGSNPSVPFSVWTVMMGGVGPAAIGLVMLMAPFVLASRLTRLRPLGPELAAWSIGYLLFILATVSVSASTPRYLLPVLSLHLALAARVSRWWHTVLLLGTLCVLQYLWVATWFSHATTP